MANTFEKTRKQIAKKRGGNIEALHQNSRNSKRLHKAQVRDDRLEKIERARKKQDRPLLERAVFFQQAVRENQNQPLALDAVHSRINEFVHRFNEEYDEIKKTRRAGRPASMREDLLRMAIEGLEKEQRDGFFMPDLTSEKNVALLDRWEGKSWPYLTNVAWVKVSAAGLVKPSSFPPSQSI
ncbi:translation machinery-associated protein 16 [Bombardia bombarda]|uniref:Translation machinery-associated protein 16 n=1 Tax=Bombardia bombarda TaxID=252184 RepID=A0AA39X171_9PEZI|nr:translation machinery-associated protein 16 [Bombardia bombarda]